VLSLFIYAIGGARSEKDEGLYCVFIDFTGKSIVKSGMNIFKKLYDMLGLSDNKVEDIKQEIQ
jgi:hypothetical protein